MSLRLVLGPMFSGKTSWIVQHVRRAQSMNIPGLLVKPNIDPRMPSETRDHVTTHNDASVPCVSWPMDRPLKDMILSYTEHKFWLPLKYIIVEEAQFCTGLLEFVDCMVDQFGKDVILVGLNGDFQRKPFASELLTCISRADEVTMLQSLCARCRDGTPGIFTHRKTSQHQVVLVGAADLYESLCRHHYLEQNAGRGCLDSH